MSTGRVVAFGPGRVNLIGEHTDYNGGRSLPFAIHLGVTVTAEPGTDGLVEVLAADLGEQDRFPLEDPRRVPGWRAFARGAVAELAAAGHELVPARLHITGTVPRGSGLSSSAALEVALCLALLALAGVRDPDRRALVRLCSRIENDWVGASTGLLDQTASLLCRAGHALRIDFAEDRTDDVPLPNDGWVLVTLDSEQHHINTAADGYNRRREECQAACRQLGVDVLSRADPSAAAVLPDPLRRRVRHVLTENARVDATVEALQRGDWAVVGQLLEAAHASLRDDFEVSTPAVEAAADRLRSAGAVGARLVGGGFGGHVLGLFPPGVPPPQDAVLVAPGSGAAVHW